MACIAIDDKVRAFRTKSREWADLRGACRRKHRAALKLEAQLLQKLAQAAGPMTVAELAAALKEPETTIYSTVLRLRARGAIVSAQREHSRAHAHAIAPEAA